jgi:hypothetical protein
VGSLEIDDEDFIEATYQDQLPAGTRRATAIADLKPPQISVVASTNRMGKTVVSWKTSEPANSVISFGTNPTNVVTVTNSTLVLQHEVGLDKLNTGQTYFFTVGSIDEGGNRTFSTKTYSFVPQRVASILIVDAYKSDQTTVDIPLSTYTEPLDQIGVSYDVWNVEQAGSPQPADMRPFRMVIWRISDSIFADNPLLLTQQVAIQEYVRQGGSWKY